MNNLMIPPDSKDSAETETGALQAATTVLGFPGRYYGKRFVYVAISSRARGLSVGLNITPDKKCNFDCAYCAVDRTSLAATSELDLSSALPELEQTIREIESGTHAVFTTNQGLPEELLELRHVALSGDGEPTLSPQFAETLEKVVHLRAMMRVPFFRIVLLTNGSRLDQPDVRDSLGLLTKLDEVWIKLDAGTPAYFQAVAQSEVPLEKILANILALGRQRAVVIQTLFCRVNGRGPASDEVDQYARRLLQLREAGAQISLVQIYSATETKHHPDVRHLPLRTLREIAVSVAKTSGLKVEVF